jgi:hypothetical protein
MTACPIPHERIRRNMMIRTLVARRAVRRVGSPSERRATPFPHRPGLLLSTLRGGSIVPPTMLKCKLYDFKWRRKRNLTLIVDKVNKTNICQPGQKVKGHPTLEVPILQECSPKASYAPALRQPWPVPGPFQKVFKLVMWSVALLQWFRLGWRSDRCGRRECCRTKPASHRASEARSVRCGGTHCH